MPVTPWVAAVGALVDSNTLDITPLAPAHQPNDILVLEVENRNNPVVLGTPAGYTNQFPSSPQGTGTPGTANAVAKAKYWKRATSSAEANPTITTPGNHHAAYIYVVRGCVESGTPFNADAGSIRASANVAANMPAVTSLRDGCLIDASVTHNIDGTLPQLNTAVNATGIPMTEYADLDGATGNGGGVAGVSGRQAIRGDTGITAGTLASAAQQGLITVAWTPREAPQVFAVGAKMDWSTVHPENYGRYSWPAHEDGDILLLVGECDNGDGVIKFDEDVGLRPVPGSPQGFGVTSSLSTRLCLFWKRARSSSELGPMIAQSGDHWVVHGITIRGAARRGRPWNYSHGSALGDEQGAGTTSVSVPGGTTNHDNCLVLLFGSNTYDNNQNAISAITNADLADLVAVIDGGVNMGQTSFNKGGGFAVVSGRKAAAGAFGATTWTLTSPTETQALFTLAISPYEDTQPNAWASGRVMDPLMHDQYGDGS